MRMLTVAAGAALLILAAGPAVAGGPPGGPRTGGGHPGGGCGSCGGGGGHPGGGHPGGGYPGGGNINVNVNANASASASAFSGASAGSYLNARAYSVSGARSAFGGGTVYVGGGYGGDAGGSLGGPVYYNEAVYEGRACGPAPFGYVLGGFGRNERHAPVCGGERHEVERDRGGRYGYSQRHGTHDQSRYEESRYESREAYSVYEGRSSDVADAGDWRRAERHGARGGHGEASGAVEYDRGYMDGRRDCDCRPDGRDGEPYVSLPEPAPYVPAPEPVYEAPMTPNQYYGIGGATPPPPPRQHYSQEPGERG